MNKFDLKYNIRLANKDDIVDIMKFIDNHWKKDHIMAKDRKLFEYEYVNGEQVNFILAIDRETNCIEGIFGFLNCSKSEKFKDIWGSIWKISDNKDNMPMLGIELAKRAKNLIGCRMHIGNGANPNTTIPLRRIFFKDKVVKMKQYYMLNNSVTEFKIAQVKNKHIIKNKNIRTDIEVIKFNDINDIKKKFNLNRIEAIPFKDDWYFNKRYFKHPYYKYDIYGILRNGMVEAIFVSRLVSIFNINIIRIVDYIGNREVFKYTNRFFNTLLKKFNCEYVDFFEFGFEDEYILEAGFKLRDEYDENIIPNYFEPFVQNNIDIWAHYKYEGTTFFKADGDQDRPNIIKEDKETKNC